MSPAAQFIHDGGPYMYPLFLLVLVTPGLFCIHFVLTFHHTEIDLRRVVLAVTALTGVLTLWAMAMGMWQFYATAFASAPHQVHVMLHLVRPHILHPMEMGRYLVLAQVLGVGAGRVIRLARGRVVQPQILSTAAHW